MKRINLPEYPKFVPLGLEHRSVLNNAFETAMDKPSDVGFALQYIWRAFDKPHLTLINGNVCIYLEPVNEPPYFLEPLGRNQLAETVDVCLKHCGAISRVSPNFVKSLPTDSLYIFEQRSQFDYIYNREELAQLKGRKFDAKRNFIKRFQRAHPDYTYVELEGKHLDEALAIYHAWLEPRRVNPKWQKFMSLSPYDIVAIKEAFLNFDELGLIGGGLKTGGKLKAFILGSPLSPDTACIHFLFAVPHIKGIYQTMLWEGMRRTFAAFKFVNLEQDAGSLGIRKYKLSYHPVRLVEKFHIIRRIGNYPNTNLKIMC